MTEKHAPSRSFSRAWVWLMPIGLLVALSLSGFAGSWWSVDSGWYAGIALQVFREGDWWTLGAGDVRYFNKPPLGFWVHGLFLWILGGDLWVIRMSMVLVASACVGVTAVIGRRLGGVWPGFWSGIVLASTIEFARHTDRFRLDYLHTLCILMAVLAIVEAVAKDKPRRVLWAGLAIGLALMTKPLAAIAVFPLGAIWLVWIGRRRMVPWLIAALGLALAVCAPWHISMALEHGSDFTATYFKSQSFERAIGADFSPEPWWWYLRHLAQTYWPWLIALGLGALMLVRGKIPHETEPLVKFGLVLGGIGLIGLSLFGDKREHYAFPIYPAFAWISGVWLAATVPQRVHTFIERRWTVLIATTLGLSGAIAIFIGPRLAASPQLPWHDLYEFIEARKDTGETEFWNGGVKYQDAGMIYAKTGVWPRWMEMPNGSTRVPPVGAFVIYGDAGETRPPNTEIKPGYWWERIVVIEWPGALPEGWSIGDAAGDRPVRDQSDGADGEDGEDGEDWEDSPP